MARNPWGGLDLDVPSPDATVAIRDALPQLTGATRRVAEVTLDDPASVASLPIAELAARAKTSQATVTRFCRQVGLSGYHELRLRLAQEVGRGRPTMWGEDLGLAIAPDDSTVHIATLLAQADIKALQLTAERLDHAVVDQVAERIAVASSIDLYGVEGSGNMAREAEVRLFRIGCRVRAWTEGHAAATSAALLGAGDVAIGISHSGRTRETVDALRSAGASGALTVALTNDPSSPLAQTADHTLVTSALETSFRRGSLACRHSQLLILDCLYVRVAQLTAKRTSAALARTAHVAPERRE